MDDRALARARHQAELTTLIAELEAAALGALSEAPGPILRDPDDPAEGSTPASRMSAPRDGDSLSKHE